MNPTESRDTLKDKEVIEAPIIDIYSLRIFHFAPVANIIETVNKLRVNHF